VAEIDFAMMRRGKVNPREANRMMQRMGMQVQQLDDVTKVIMESPTRRIVIDNPEVATVTVQGQTIYQVGGGTMREEGLGGGSDEDAKLVASQAGVSMEQAANALKQSGGDLAQAIILLKQKRIP
jgi:nascent polypeptide-associated complex subunit alpha